MSKWKQIKIEGTRDDTTQGLVELTDSNHFKVALFDEDGNAVVVNASDNLQTVINELATGISDNAGTQLKTSLYSPSGTAAEVTASNNQQVSIEELASALSSNGGAQLNITLFDEGGIPASVDDNTETLQTIDYPHHEIHGESHYFIMDVVDMPINDVVDIQITTPNALPESHIVFRMDAESEKEWFFYEDVSIVTAGTSITPYNNYRKSVNTSQNTFAIIQNTSVANANADTATAGATQILHGIIGAGRDSGRNKRENEIILKNNTSYSIRLIASAAGYVDYNLEWYEHTPKN